MNLKFLREGSITLTLLYLATILYIASIYIFARPDNVFYSNLAFVALVGAFSLHEVVQTNRDYYTDRILILYGIFLLFCLFSLFWSIDVPISAEMVRRMGLIFFSLLLIYNILRKYHLFSAIVLGTVVGSVATYLIAFGIFHPPFATYFPGSGRFMGTTINPNILGANMIYALFLAIVALHLKAERLPKWLHVAGVLHILLATVVVLMTVSRTAMVIAALMLLLFLVQAIAQPKQRRALGIAALLVGAVLVLAVDPHLVWQKVHFAIERIGYIFDTLSGYGDVEYSAEERLELAEGALQLFAASPFIGNGVDAVRSVLGVYAHNNFVELLADGGVVGFVLYYAIFFVLGYKMVHIHDRWLRIYGLFFLLLMLLYDLGGVFYYDKLTLTVVVTLAYLAERYEVAVPAQQTATMVGEEAYV